MCTVIHCTWNAFTIENLGVSKLQFPATQKIASRQVTKLITHHVDEADERIGHLLGSGTHQNDSKTADMR